MRNISIIVPFKNTPLIWFERLLFSLKNQTNKNFEAIFIDDNSLNGTLYKDLVTKNGFIYELNKDPNNQNHAGLLRDYGLSLAKNEFIWFIDSDDWISLDAIDYLLNTFEKNSEIDLVIFDYHWVHKDQDFLIAKSEKLKVDGYVLENEPNKKMTNWFFRKFQTDWRVCFKKSFLINNKLSHNKSIYLYEDVYYGLVWKCLFNKAYFSFKKLYFYNRLNANSILNTTKFNPNLLFNAILSSKEMLLAKKSFSEKWYFYSTNWLFFYICVNAKYTNYLSTKSFKKTVAQNKKYRSRACLGFSSRWFVANVLLYVPWLANLIKKILKFD